MHLGSNYCQQFQIQEFWHLFISLFPYQVQSGINYTHKQRILIVNWWCCLGFNNIFWRWIIFLLRAFSPQKGGYIDIFLRTVKNTFFKTFENKNLIYNNWHGYLVNLKKRGWNIYSYLVAYVCLRLMLTDLIACGVRFHRYLALFLQEKTHKCLNSAPTQWCNSVQQFRLLFLNYTTSYMSCITQ